MYALFLRRSEAITCPPASTSLGRIERMRRGFFHSVVDCLRLHFAIFSRGPLYFLRGRSLTPLELHSPFLGKLLGISMGKLLQYRKRVNALDKKEAFAICLLVTAFSLDPVLNYGMYGTSVQYAKGDRDFVDLSVASWR